MRVLFLIILSVSLAACEKTIEIEIPRKDPRLVINGFLRPGENFKIFVGKTRHILDPESNTGYYLDPYVVKDATVVLFRNSDPIDTLVFDAVTRQFFSTEFVQAGFTYTIKVTAPGFVQAEALSIVPAQSEIKEVIRIKNARTRQGNISQDEIILKFDDPAGVADFYQIAIYSPWYALNCVSTIDKDIEPIGENADPLSTDNCYDARNILLKDVNFDGKEKIVRLFVDSYDLQEMVDPSTGTVYKPYILFNRITEEQFKFIKSYHVYYNSSDNPFAEPTNVFSNVTNGLGVFSLYTMDKEDL